MCTEDNEDQDDEDEDSDLDRENDGKDSTRKSLEKDFQEAEQADLEEAYSSAKTPNIAVVDDDESEIPQFTINPVAT